MGIKLNGINHSIHLYGSTVSISFSLNIDGKLNNNKVYGIKFELYFFSKVDEYFNKRIPFCIGEKASENGSLIIPFIPFTGKTDTMAFGYKQPGPYSLYPILAPILEDGRIKCSTSLVLFDDQQIPTDIKFVEENGVKVMYDFNVPVSATKFLSVPTYSDLFCQMIRPPFPTESIDSDSDFDDNTIDDISIFNSSTLRQRKRSN